MPTDPRKKPTRALPSKKKKRRKKSGFKRLLKRAGGLLNWYYAKTTDPEERETRIKPKLLGRTVTYAGFMIMMVIAILLITIILNNRSVGVEHEQIVVTGLPGDFEGYKILVISDLNGRSFPGAPDLTVEILSDSTRSKDMLLKTWKYKNAGVREYWIIDPRRKLVLVYDFSDEDLQPQTYSFTDSIPVLISERRCSIDFAKINKELEALE